MCLLVLAWNVHPRYRLVIAANRDEFHARPAAPLGWWQDDTGLLAGRDLQGNGTWMGVTRTGRCGVVTNYRDLEAAPGPGAPSRGELVVDYLQSASAPGAHLEQLQPRASRYAGFNLLLGDGSGLWYYSNRGDRAPRRLEPGVYGLSNHLLDSPWPKLLRVRDRFAELVGRPSLEPNVLFEMLADRRTADDDEIPETGLPPDWERALSAPFVMHERYGTRCSTLLLVEHDGNTTMFERRFDATGAQTGSTRMQFKACPSSALTRHVMQPRSIAATSADGGPE